MSVQAAPKAKEDEEQRMKSYSLIPFVVGFSTYSVQCCSYSVALYCYAAYGCSLWQGEKPLPLLRGGFNTYRLYELGLRKMLGSSGSVSV